MVEEQFVIDIDCVNDDLGLHFSWDPNVDCVDSFAIYINNDFIGFQVENFYSVDTFPSETMVNIRVEVFSTCLCSYPILEASCITADCPSIALDLNISDTIICKKELPQMLQLTVTNNGGNLPSQGDLNWTGTSIDNNGMITTLELPVGIHQYDVEYNYDDNCSYTTTISIEVVDLGLTSFEIIHPKCYKENYGLIIFDEMAGNEVDSIFINNTKVKWDKEMYFDLGISDVLIRNNFGCEETFSIEVIPATEPSLTIINDVEIINGMDNDFSYSGSINYDSVAWYIDGALICSGIDCNPLTVTEFDSDNIDLCLIGYFEEGCDVETCVPIIIEEIPSIFIPTVFNPNSGDKNGNWIIGSNTELIISNIQIFDRWGNAVLVLQNLIVNGEQEVWDGKMNGTDVVSGVYVFLIEYVDEFGNPQRKVGDITLIR